MSGAMSRRKGADAERQVVNWLRTNGLPYAERRGAGFEASDIIGCPGVTIEVKNRAEMRLPSWVRQMIQEMATDRNQIGVVIHKRQRCTDVARWYATTTVDVWRILDPGNAGVETWTYDKNVKLAHLDLDAGRYAALHPCRGLDTQCATMSAATFMHLLAHVGYATPAKQPESNQTT